MTRLSTTLALSALALGFAVPASAVDATDAVLTDDDVQKKKKDDKKPKTVTVWILEAKGSG